MVISLCWKLEWSDGIGGMPGGHWGGWAGKLISEEIWNPEPNDRKESSIDHDNAYGNLRCFTFLEVLIFRDFPQYQGSLNQHICIKIAASESFCTMCYSVVKNTCLLISLINAHFTSRFSRLALWYLNIYQTRCSCILLWCSCQWLSFWGLIIFHVNSASHALYSEGWCVWFSFACFRQQQPPPPQDPPAQLSHPREAPTTSSRAVGSDTGTPPAVHRGHHLHTICHTDSVWFWLYRLFTSLFNCIEFLNEFVISKFLWIKEQAD